MKKLNKKISDKQKKRGKEIKIDCECDMSKKAKSVNAHTRMCGKEPKVYRFASPGSGIARWKKR